MAIDVVSRLILGEAYILEGLPPTEQLLGTESQHDVHSDKVIDLLPAYFMTRIINCLNASASAIPT